MIFFYINHFSLIIFYHSVWLGFELFGLRVQVHSHWVQFYTRAQRIWQSLFVIINPLTGNGAGVWMTLCPEEMVLRIWGFWEDVSSILTVERCSWVFDRWRRQSWVWGRVSIVWLAWAFKNRVSLVSPWIEIRNW